MISITYNEALKYLHQTYADNAKAGLEGVSAIMAKIGNPQDRLSVIHVAGTNGKGSNCAYMQHILAAAGFKVGVFTSPHLHRYNERIAINMQPVSDESFAKLITDVVAAAGELGLDKVSAGGQSDGLAFFEVLTCMAYKCFADENVDIAIIETGIGGRLDSTNIINNPLLSVITAPGYDHQDMLGDTLKEITAEDAGIIKENCPVAVYPTPMLPVIKEIAQSKNAPLYYIDKSEVTNINYSITGTEFSVKTAYFSYQSLRIRLLGEHQLQNAIHALLCVEALRRHRVLEISDDAVKTGLAQCRWPGRFEIVPKSDGVPYIILDGAHNEDGAIIFRQALERYFPDQPLVLVIGISMHKDYRNILCNIIGTSTSISKDTIICTNSSFRGIPAEELAGYVKELMEPGCQATVLHEEDCKKALNQAIKIAGPEGVVTVAGSLYLIGDLYQSVIT